MPRPDGYVRVSFAADDGIKLKEQKAYYVKKNAGITLGNADLAKPTYEPQTGYEFSNWDKEDTLEIKDDNILVTAKAKVLADFDTVTHPGYVKVTFKAGENGVIKENGNEINEKVYYVNPNKYVNLKAPTPVADTGYEFAAWSKPGDDNFSLANFIKYPNETTITAKFNLVNTVIPIIDGKPSKPKNFVKVTFKFDANSEGHGNLIGTKEYYVDSTQAVTLTPPTVEANIGYKFNKWSQDANTATKYEEDTIIECKLEKLDDIIKAKEDDTDDAIPHGYVLVYFYAGNQGTAKGQAMYYVNPKAGKTIKDLTKPEVTEKTGYKFIKWDTDDNEDIKDNKVIYAAYEELDDKILVTPGVQQPDGYVKVTFAAGENGRIDARSYYVNPNKYVKLDPPATYPAQNYEFSLWDPDVRNFTRYKKDTTITAKFRLKELVITKTDPNATVPSGYIELNFIIDEDSKGRGNLEGNTSYFVKKDVLVTINPPRPNPNIGFKFVEWDFDTTEPKKYSTGKTIKASFTGFDPILPSTDDKGTTIARPQGYVVVHFLNGEHGRLSGETIYYVNPKAGKTLKDIAQKPSVIEDTGYVFDKWSEDESTAIKKDLTIKAQYTERPDIITAGPDQTAPRGYVVIIFKTDGNGTMTSRIKDEYGANAKNVHEIVYFVNPNKKIKLTKGDAGPNLLPVPDTKPNDNYDFDGWFNDIDEEKPIIRGRVHVAKFKPAKVKLTYFANGADGTPPAELEVNHNTSVRLAGPGNLKKTDAKFLGWKIGDDTNLKQAGDEIILTEDTKAVAQWKNDKKIIEYNPEEPTTRPDGYLRVTFAADDGLKLTEQKAYYVKKGTKLADIKKNNEYGYPSVGPKTGYKFDDKWDEGKTIEINGDTVVTAKSTKLGTVIPATGAPNEKPNGYKEVTFVVKAEDAAKGSITGVAKFYVNPTEYVTITSPPTAKAETGFEFGGWNPNPSIPKVYDEDTTIIASFNGLKDIVPKTADDESEKPKGYVTVKFDIDGEGGSIVEGETKTYYADPSKKITLKAPKTLAKTGYEFEKWVIKPNGTEQEINLDDENTYKKNTTIYGKFKELKDIIPEEENGKTNAKPDGYVKVTFISETNGKLRDGDKKVYYVNPNSRTLGALTKPELIPDIGFEEDSWNILGVGAYDGRMSISGDMIVNAKYKALDPVVPKTTNDDSERPKGYIEVTFKTTDKAGSKEKTIYINPNKAVKLEDQAPEVNPMTGYQFAGWSRPVKEKVQYEDRDVITAQFNKLGDVIPQENPNGSDQPVGYLKVTFVKGDHGELTGKTVYYVKPNTEVTVTAPKVTAQTGYKFTNWDQELTQTFKNDTKITAQYDLIADVVPQENPDGSDKPDGYITITFVKGEHGELSGKTVYYVKPDIPVEVPAPTVTADLGYKFARWDTALQNKFERDTIITAKYGDIDDVVPQKNPDGSDKPAGYVSVKFIPTDKATETKEKVYYVNPSKEVEITVTPVGTKVKDANGVSYDYTFTGWTVTRGTINSWSVPRVSGKFIQDTEITAKYSVTRGNIMPLPLAKDNAVTAIKDTPKAEDLIKNLYDANNPDNKNNLPSGTTFKYTDDGTPDVSGPGKATAKVEVKYPNGRTSIVTVPLTVVDHVVPQIGNDKPLVPDDYVEVIVDTTDKATENTYYVKTFWVKPEEMVTIPALKPTGKEIKENGVRKTNQFKYWLSDNKDKEYQRVISDSFSSKRPKTTITAVYEFEDNKKAEPNNGIKVPLNSKPDPKDFIKNVYNDNDPNNKNNLPPGTKFEFADGDPDTSQIGPGKSTRIKITYPNGEVRDNVYVSYEVSGDVVEQTDPNKKPDVPDSFVRVVIKAANKFYANGNELTDEEVDELEFKNLREVDRTFWVDPTKKVTIKVQKAEKFTDKQHRTWSFNHWQVLDKYGNGKIYKTLDEITDEFTDIDGTVIQAIYSRDDVEVPGEKDLLITELGVEPTADQYKANLKAPVGKTIDKVDIITPPDVSRTGMTTAKLKVTYGDKTEAEFIVKVFVKDRYDPRPSEPQIIYRDRIVEKEKIVEKVIKIKDDERLKELRYMQGFSGKFRPYDGLRRAEAAQILANALKADAYIYDPNYAIDYKDVGNTWYTEAVRIVSQAGVFQGYSDGTFRPEGKITRAEWIATLRRFQNLKKVSGNDMGLSMNHWATEEIEAAYQAGWLEVYTSGIASFDYNKPITRQEVAAISNKAFDRVLDKIYLYRNSRNMIDYIDVDNKMPLYEDILCASNTLLTDGKYYKANAIGLDDVTFNIVTDMYRIYQKKFQIISH
ncbi:MAG: InlB B-repeat-containing protein [Fenollaria massiliensis]